MTGVLYDLTEKWKSPGFATIIVVLISAVIFTKITRLKFFLFLVASSTYVLLFRYPELSNHLNLILLINFSLIIGIIYSWRNANTTDEDYYKTMLPFLRLSLVLVYFLAGFHKFNQDFFNLKVSCAGGMFRSTFLPMLNSRLLGIPSGLILGISLVFLVSKLWGYRLRSLPKSLYFFLLVMSTLLAVIAVGIFTKTQIQILNIFTKPTVIFLVPVIVVIWEIIGGLLLLVPKLQGLILLFCWIMHSSFALMGFTDFGSLAFAIIFTFIPSNYLNVLSSNPNVQIGKYQISRIYVYFLILLFASFLTGICYGLGIDIKSIQFITGILLNFAVIVIMWPILQTLCSNKRIPWKGVPLWTKQTPKFTALLVLLIFAHGITPYFGLRTAGNFSMFSNLRTEGKVSNHLLLANNSLKIWGYQEDVVEIVEIDDEAAKIGHKYVPLRGYRLPLIEFKKLIHKWTQANYTVPITFRYDGVTHSSKDIVNDPNWITTKRNWEMYLMDFRVIQPEGLNQCRW